MSIRELGKHTSKQGVTTAVWMYEEAKTLVVQQDFLHMSFFEDDFRDFAETIIVALAELDAGGTGQDQVNAGLTLITGKEQA